MTPGRRLRIAILAHSVNPRGGVVHALGLADALAALGHAAVVHAPDPAGAGFFRPTVAATVPVPAAPVQGTTRELVEARIADYVRHFADPAHRRFDVFHAQDGISGNALATLAERGLIGGFARTVHHVDSFADPRLAALQARSIRAADRHVVVSPLWRDRLAASFGVAATVTGNGVDRTVFTPRPDGREPALRARLAPGPGPVFLAVGGVEARKNTVNILRAFARLAAERPQARLVIAGGVSLLDHGAYRRSFDEALAGLGAIAERVVLAGAIDQADMPALYRMADALVFPSVKEGFGLVAIEAIACGTPVVTARIAPFTGLFGEADVAFCDPANPADIAVAMRRTLLPGARAAFAARADVALAPHDWGRVAAAHLPVYRQLREVVDA